MMPQYADGTREFITDHCPRCVGGCDCACCVRWNVEHSEARNLYLLGERLPETFKGRPIVWVDENTPAPTPPAKDEWLDAPDGDGWWWRMGKHDKAPEAGYVRDRLWSGPCNIWAGSLGFDGAKWKRAEAPAPPAPPLPKSRQVTLTAVIEPEDDDWRAVVHADSHPLDSPQFSKKQGAIDYVRRVYGIEPEVRS
jgi:hypothetical protein